VKFNSIWTNGEVASFKQDKPFDVGPVQTDDAPTAYKRVLETGGAILPKRDSVDTRIVNGVNNRSGRIISSQEQVGGWPRLASANPALDSDGDGMPDAWEKKNALNPNDPDDRIKTGKDGYTMLETFLNNIH
jgi:pectate lyase